MLATTISAGPIGGPLSVSASDFSVTSEKRPGPARFSADTSTAYRVSGRAPSTVDEQRNLVPTGTQFSPLTWTRSVSGAVGSAPSDVFCCAVGLRRTRYDAFAFLSIASIVHVISNALSVMVASSTVTFCGCDGTRVKSLGTYTGSDHSDQPRTPSARSRNS